MENENTIDDPMDGSFVEIEIESSETHSCSICSKSYKNKKA
jgi:hypothetical protein